MSSKKVYVVGVGMTKFEKPGRRKDVDYTDFALEAVTKALIDANLNYDDIQYAAVGYCFGIPYFSYCIITASKFYERKLIRSSLNSLRRLYFWSKGALSIRLDPNPNCERQQ